MHVAALAAIAGAVRDRATAQVVAITGSTGKTSTKDILFALCAPTRRTIANEGNYNNEIGVPLTLCRLEPETELLIAEMGMRGLGQIAWLASFTKPDIAAITNVGPVHLELVDTVENVARAKAELIEALRPGGVAVVPADEPLLEPYLGRGDIVVERVDPDSALPFTTSFESRHQLANARTAVAVARCLEVTLPDELTVEFSKLREEERPLPGGGLLLNDCYNANPVSMRAALEHLAERGRGHRRVAVLGEMAELGREADAYHREIGGLVRRLGIEQVIAVGRARACVRRRLGAVGRRGRHETAGRAPSRRRGAREGLTLGGTRDGGGEPRHLMAKVLIAALVAMIIAILAGPRFIAFLRKNEFGQHIREEGPEHHAEKQGTPTMGGLLIVAVASIAFVAVSRFTVPALTIFGTTLACGAIGFLDDFTKLRHRRSLGLSGRWKMLLLLVDHGRRRRGCAPPAAEPLRLHPDRRPLGAARTVLVRAPLPDHRRLRQRREPHRRPRRPRRRNGDHRARRR